MIIGWEEGPRFIGHFDVSGIFLIHYIFLIRVVGKNQPLRLSGHFIHDKPNNANPKAASVCKAVYDEQYFPTTLRNPDSTMSTDI